MWGTNTTLEDKKLLESVAKVYRRVKKRIETELKRINPSITIHFERNIPYSYIKDANKCVNKNVDYIGTLTDSGKEKKSSADGGVITIKLLENFRLPLLWVEGKTSYSCTKGKGTRGQATGLITEQAERCRTWVSVSNHKFKPLLAFMQGTDFNSQNGIYNIDRIRGDLHTIGNVNPYDEGTDGVSWLYFQEKFSQSDLENIIEFALLTNVEEMKKVLETLVF